MMVKKGFDKLMEPKPFMESYENMLRDVYQGTYGS
jgi:hypothetical protein